MRNRMDRWGILVLVSAVAGVGCSGSSDGSGRGYVTSGDPSGTGGSSTPGDDASSGTPPDGDPGTTAPPGDGGTTTPPGDDAAVAPPTGDDAGTTPGGEQDGGAGDPDSSTPSTPTRTRKIKDLTGLQTSSGQFRVGGTDLGIPVRQPNGKIAYIFGDTFDIDGVGGNDWRSPVLLRSEPGNLSAGITFTSAAGGQHAKQILAYQHNHKNPDYSTWLPSDVITIGDRMYLHFMVNNGLGNVAWSQIAYSDDNGENWTVSGARWEGNEDGGLRQLWTWERGTDGFVYAMSTKFDRKNALIMYRVPEDRLLDRSAYVPWGFRDGQWNWGNAPTPILPGAFGEMCLRRVESKWVLSWFNAGEYNITIKVFDGPTSDLHKATTYTPILGGGWGGEDDTHVAQLYGGYIHPDSTLHELTLIVSQWNTVEAGGKKDWPYHAMQFVTGVN